MNEPDVAGQASIERFAWSPEIGALLRDTGMATADLGDTGLVTWWGLHEGRSLAGVIGLESFGRTGLLRSLAIAADCRGRGYGRLLVAECERGATASGMDTLYLLTETAAAYFVRLGYQHLPREQAPVAVARSSQFTSLCPASAAFMMRHLRGVDANPAPDR